MLTGNNPVHKIHKRSRCRHNHEAQRAVFLFAVFTDREEIQEAFETGSGSAVRNSSTLTEQTYYEARRLSDGTVLRISANQASAWALMMDLLWPIILIAVLAIGLLRCSPVAWQKISWSR